MGDRINLRFRDGEEVSPVLYAHWDGMSLLQTAEEFYDRYSEEIRHEPSNWMVNFISYIRGGKVLDGEYYLFQDFNGCSADDNGDWEFDLQTGRYHPSD